MASLLVVDDDAEVLDALCAVLRGAGYEIEPASGGVAALDVLERKRIDLLLTDVVMRGLNGFNLARIAVQRRPALKVLYYSGFTEFTIGREGQKLGKLLHKPLRADDLRREVASAGSEPALAPSLAARGEQATLSGQSAFSRCSCSPVGKLTRGASRRKRGFNGLRKFVGAILPRPG